MEKYLSTIYEYIQVSSISIINISSESCRVSGHCPISSKHVYSI